MENYKGYFISGSAVSTYLTGRQSKALGIVLKSGRLGSVIEVKRIEGPAFDSKQDAEQHGLELCKAWVDEYEAIGKNMDALARRFAETHDTGSQETDTSPQPSVTAKAVVFERYVPRIGSISSAIRDFKIV